MEALKVVDLKPPLNLTKVTDSAGLKKLADFFTRCNGIVGWDIETTPLKDYFWRRIRTIQFGNQTEQYVIDLLAFCNGDSDLLYKAQGEYGKNLPDCLKTVLEVIAPVVCGRDILKVGVNLGFEYLNFYWLLGLRTQHFFDCSLAERCIWAGAHSLKDYSYYSMEELMLRYFGVQIDKSLQESFNLESPLSEEQYAYAALDTRFPLGIRQVQNLILQGETHASLLAKGSPSAKYLKNIDPSVTGDNLLEVVKIENDAIGAFQDMHVHGENIDREPWLARIAKRKQELKEVIEKELDPIFLPIVGSKLDVITDEDIEKATTLWKSYNTVSAHELELKAISRKNKLLPDLAAAYEVQRAEAEKSRKVEKEHFKTVCADLKKKRTAINNLAAKCEGNALINYDSEAQLLVQLKMMPGLKDIKDTKDETLEKFCLFPVMSALRKYRGLSKEISTYGDAWATEWKTHPCKEEGWLHPGDGKLHCTFNQLDAETGRSSSEQPNDQNLPQEKEVRSCFIADPPNENIRISKCCEVDTQLGICEKCLLPCDTHAEESVLITADQSGAELRIIADDSNDEVWINAFARKEDLHSVGTEILYPEEWAKEALPGCAYYLPHTPETVAANPLVTLGDAQRQKCKCPKHGEMRNDNKSQNFLIAYGGGPDTLAKKIKKSVKIAREQMALHRLKFTGIWDYLDKSGKMAQMQKKAFDMFGRRRLFPEPTWDRASAKAKSDNEKELRYSKEESAKNKAMFMEIHKRKPTDEELWFLKHRPPTNKEIGKAFKAIAGGSERQGKNHRIQGTNATISKLAMGCGFCPAGKPYLWHVFSKYKATLVKFVHDELVVQCPKRYGKIVAELIGDAFKRAAAEKMKKVIMEFEYHIGHCWEK